MTKKLTLLIIFVMLFTTVFAGNTSLALAAEGSTTKTVQATPVKKVVAPVKTVSAKLYASNIVTVSWTKAKNVTGYALYEKKGTKYNRIRTINTPNTASAKISKVSKGVNHTYAVRAFVKSNNQYTYSTYKQATVYVPNVMTKKTKGYSNTTAAKLIKTAKSKVGSKYVSGAQGPNQFDCSGYVYYVTKKANVSPKKISRTSSASMWSNLKSHSIGTKKLSKAQPGDIVFLSSSPNSRISHVAFYYGDNQYIHATSPGVGVAVTPTRYYGYVQGIVRLPNM